MHRRCPHHAARACARSPPLRHPVRRARRTTHATPRALRPARPCAKPSREEGEETSLGDPNWQQASGAGVGIISADTSLGDPNWQQNLGLQNKTLGRSPRRPQLLRFGGERVKPPVRLCTRDANVVRHTWWTWRFGRGGRLWLGWSVWTHATVQLGIRLVSPRLPPNSLCFILVCTLELPLPARIIAG